MANPDGSTTPALRIRRAGISDARAIAEITIRAWQAAYRGIFPDDYLDNLSVHARETALRDRFERDPGGAMPSWLAEREERPIAFLSSGPPRDEDLPHLAAEVYAIYALPEVWRGAAGRALMETAIRHWRALGAVTLALWVLESNDRARLFYEALGWRPDGARQPLEIGGVTVMEVRYRLSPHE